MFSLPRGGDTLLGVNKDLQTGLDMAGGLRGF